MDIDIKRKHDLLSIAHLRIEELANRFMERIDIISVLKKEIHDNTQIFHREIAKIMKYLPKGYIIDLREDHTLEQYIDSLECDVTDYGDQEDAGFSFTDGFNTAKSKILDKLKEGDNH